MSLLEVQGLNAELWRLRAVSNLSFAVERGSILGIIGPNGAGKTTTFSLISGFDRPSAGEVLFKGEQMTGLSPDVICLRGLTRTFQIMQAFPKLTVLQNVMIGAYARHRAARQRVVMRRKSYESLGWPDVWKNRPEILHWRTSNVWRSQKRWQHRLSFCCLMRSFPDLHLRRWRS